MRIPRRALEVLRAEGVRGLWWRGLGVTVYRRLLLLALLVESRPAGGPGKLGVTIEVLDPADIDDYLALRPDTSRSEVERRLRTGQRCSLVRLDGVPVSARWFATGRAEVPYFGLAFELPERVGYVYDVYTARSARQLGISAEVRTFHVAILFEEGVGVLLGTAAPENAAGLRMIAAAGYRPVATIGCLRLGPLRLPLRRGARRYLGRARRF